MKGSVSRAACRVSVTLPLHQSCTCSTIRSIEHLVISRSTRGNPFSLLKMWHIGGIHYSCIPQYQYWPLSRTLGWAFILTESAKPSLQIGHMQNANWAYRAEQCSCPRWDCWETHAQRSLMVPVCLNTAPDLSLSDIWTRAWGLLLVSCFICSCQ